MDYLFVNEEDEDIPTYGIDIDNPGSIPNHCGSSDGGCQLNILAFSLSSPTIHIEPALRPSLQSEPLQSEPLQSEPLQSEPLQSEPLQRKISEVLHPLGGLENDLPNIGSTTSIQGTIAIDSNTAFEILESEELDIQSVTPILLERNEAIQQMEDGEISEESIQFSNRELRGSVEEDDEYVNECGKCDCKTYEVSPELNSMTGKCYFFSKILGVKTIQLAVINLWILFQEIISATGIPADVFEKENSILLFVAMGIFVFLQILIRVYIYHRGHAVPFSAALVMTIILTICISYLCGALISIYDMRKSMVIQLTLTLLLVFGCLTLLPLTNTRNIDVTKTQTLGTAAFATLLFSLLIKFVIGILEEGKISLEFKGLPKTWIPIFLSAEFIVMIIIIEINLILSGKRFNVSESDWLSCSVLM